MKLKLDVEDYEEIKKIIRREIHKWKVEGDVELLNQITEDYSK